MGTIKTADSWWEPSTAQVADAKAQGYGGWLGYRASGPNENVYHSWAATTFAMLKVQGMVTAAYYSGLEDPAWVKADAASLGIPAILDCESGMRGMGVWTDPWLTASGAALYGSALVMDAHYTHGHPGYVLAGYPGGVQSATWPPGVPVPPQPKGWQWANPNIHPVSFGSVDTSNFDAAFFGAGAGKEESVFWVKNPSTNECIVFSGGFGLGIPDEADLLAIQRSGVTELTGISQAFFDSIPMASAAVGQVGPQGPEGPQGPPGPQGSLPANATISGTVTLG
jgi:hypothetical protein